MSRIELQVRAVLPGFGLATGPAACADGPVWRIDPETAALETLAETADPRPQAIAVAPHQPRGVYGGRRGRCLPFALTSDPLPELP